MFIVAGCSHNRASVNTQTDTNTKVEEKKDGAVMKKTNSVIVEDQEVIGGKIIIAKVVSDSPAWLVIHSDNSGAPGPVIGQVYVQKGENKDLPVDLDVPKITPKLFAMLHVDAGKIGQYEFPGADAPVKDGDTIVMDDFMSTTSIKKDISGPVMEKKETTQTAPVTREFNMTAKKWEFSPATITVNKGDKVKLSIKSLDVNHGFAISDFNVDKKLIAGQTTIVEFTTDKTGTFTFSCSEFCGVWHSGMKGTIIVK